VGADAASVGPVDWAGHAGSPADASSLVDLAGVLAGSLSGAELVDAIVASEKALSLLTGLQMRLLAAFAVPFVAGDPMRLAARLARKSCATGDDSPEQVQLFVPDAAVSLAAAEVAAALRISPVTAGIRVREAETMTTVLAPTFGGVGGRSGGSGEGQGDRGAVCPVVGGAHRGGAGPGAPGRRWVEHQRVAGSDRAGGDHGGPGRGAGSA